ncbi:hypothetical protein [Lacinutrix jangbogonensis]|uniref:hypothetical protein n=1 Tax=Lacinutrix jangbogonensis TaxID=1469557 RepID=UPI00053E1A4F|nr:hypothetical protein [Lacinutrix jangbogonensis]
MKQILFLLIITLYSYQCYSQNIIIVDTITKKPIAFAAIKFNENGFYTSDDGIFNLNKIDANLLEVNLLLESSKTNTSDTYFKLDKNNKL